MWQLAALAISLAIEMPIVRALAGWLEHKQPQPWRIWALAAAATLLTHPFAWWGTLELAETIDYGVIFIAVEAAVFTAEAAFFRFVARWRWRTAFGASLAANTASALAGLLLWELV